MDVCFGCIVEGQGESSAVPILLRRITEAVDQSIRVHTVIARHSRNALVRQGELERAVQALSYRLQGNSGILILLDSDDDQPCVLGPDLLQRAQRARPDVRIRLVLATREYETWFLAAAESLAGKSGLRPDLVRPPEPEIMDDTQPMLSRIGESFRLRWFEMQKGGWLATWNSTKHTVQHVTSQH